MSDPRLTRQTLAVLAEMLVDPTQARYGLDLAERSGVRKSTIYDTLLRLETGGWAESSWEKLPASEAGRPRRRLYRLTGLGAEKAREALTNEVSRISPKGSRNRTQPSFIGKPQPAGSA